jgi:plasmid stabilization system protein ParE
VNPPVLRPAAAADVEEAWRWYEARRAGLGDEFLEAVRAALESIRAHPESAPLVRRDIHRHLLRRFPYGLFYRIIQGQVVVVACFHAKRSPRVWRSLVTR